MNTEYILQATIRENRGTSSSKKIRRDNGIPAVVYGGKDNSNIVLDSNEVSKQIKDSDFIVMLSSSKLVKKQLM